jgi:hypothetical protein
MMLPSLSTTAPPWACRGRWRQPRSFLDGFVQHYHDDRHHNGIGLHTPGDVHHGLAEATND